MITNFRQLQLLLVGIMERQTLSPTARAYAALPVRGSRIAKRGATAPWSLSASPVEGGANRDPGRTGPALPPPSRVLPGAAVMRGPMAHKIPSYEV